MIKLALTFPVSTNRLFNNRKSGKGRGRIPTPEYEAWRHENGWEIQIQKPGRIGGKVRVDIKLQDGRKLDPDNGVKCIFDLLVEHGVIDGDGPKVIRDHRVRYDASISGAMVEIFPIPEAA